MYDEKVLLNNGVNLSKSLELFGDIETYNETLDDFLEDVEEKLEKIKSYKESADMANYSILTHSLKSDAQYFGFDTLADYAFEHEKASKSNNMYYVYDNYDLLMKEARRIINVVKNYKGIATDSTVDNIKEKKKEETIIVVDDSNVIVNFINKFFKDKYNVLIAKDGLLAIEQISDTKQKIVGMLLDLNMPNVDGYDVLKYMKINNLFDKIKVAIITGTDSKLVLENVKDYPIVAILEKPFSEVNIRKVVEMLINENEG